MPSPDAPDAVAAALQRAVRRQQADWAAQATPEGAARRRRRLAVAVALLALVEGLQGALSAETALGLLAPALALHARMSPSSTTRRRRRW